ncbi:NAD(P)-binding protein [Dissoconium aciculare CBS 342.82]|uniref:NAD(P)-binding protein n=1 Tax=Dissoconium aciculare CBS 342.82 TaxID=1314786 RepID=A0A6J3LTK9_9PEZI|nr:NAD(P)-binding protein [Dissoconium aciculare CBS 342.82]KAF1818614.1 NAD(P)-binding protein [Dissoconium aciculare CBS 342.82]
MAPKIALITGCSTGIGHALAVEFASRGYQVIATARNTASLKQLELDHSNIKALALDVCDGDSIDRLYDEVSVLANGGLAYLVNNAGAHYAAPAIELEADRIRNVFETNVVGVMRMCAKFSKLLIAGRGTIVQIGSVTRAVPVVWQSPYNATKAALSQYTKTLRLELQPFGVHVCEVVTGYVQSNILRDGLQSAPDSLYTPIKDHIETMKNKGNSNGMPAAVYARRVVDKLVRKNPPPEFWEGAQSWYLYYITTWIPTWISHKIFYAVFKLAKLRR